MSYKPLIAEGMDGREPDWDAVYKDRLGDYWWYGTDAYGKEGWVWGSGERPQNVGGQSLACGHARTWGYSVGSDLPWNLVGILRDGRFLDCLNAPEPVVIRDSATGFVVKDSGVREEYANGFVRDTEQGKYDYSRILQIEGLHLIPIEALERWGAHMVKGAEKYGEDNWRQARGLVAIARFIRSLCRHTVQFIRRDRTEDHPAAVCFNVWAAELTPETED